MAAEKLNISLDARVAETLRQRAREQAKPVSRYLTELIEADARRHRDALAAEGYRLLGAEMAGFAADALPLAGETWPEWQEQDAAQGTQAGQPHTA